MRTARIQSKKLIPSVAVAFVLAMALAVTATQSAQAQTFTLLYTFTGGTDGAYPAGGLVQDSAGNLYGTTPNGGSGLWCAVGCGTVFKVNTAGQETVLHSFAGAGTGDGSIPEYGSLIRDGAGNLYGTTFNGGTHNNGTVFRLSPTGKETVISFTGGANGGYPAAGLVPDAAGNVYGTTTFRGSGCAPFGCGTVFKVSSAGKETALYSFCSLSNCADGSYPYGGVVRDSAGNLYGTTYAGGASGAGTVFKVDTSGQETVLHSFTGPPDGYLPFAGLVMDNAGNLYGTTIIGGTEDGGAVFKVNSTSGQETVLYSFCSQPGCTDGQLPYAALVWVGGFLYGTTEFGGASGAGTVFEVNPANQETVLYSFCSQLNCADGGQPTASLLRDTAGNLYGTTSGLGAYGAGTVFKVAP